MSVILKVSIASYVAKKYPCKKVIWTILLFEKCLQILLYICIEFVYQSFIFGRVDAENSVELLMF